MKIIGRIFEYLEFKGFTAAEFERKNSLSNGYLRKMRLRDADIGETILLQIIENCPDISVEWLVTGEGAMLKADKEPQPASEPPTAEPEVVSVLRQQLAEKDRQIAEKDRQLAERDKQTGILLRMLSAQKTPEKSPIGGG